MKTEIKKKVEYIIAGTYRQVLGSFLIDRQARGLAKGTVKYYEQELNQFAAWLDDAGIVQFEEITADLLRAYLLSLEQKREEGRGRSPGGVHASYRSLRALFNWYMEEFEPDDWKNPIRKVKAPKVNKNPLPGIPLDNVLAMIEHCQTINAKRDRALFMVLLDTGVRASELIALNLRDVNPVSGEIQVRKGKGGKARTVFLGSKARKAVRAYLKERGTVYDDDALFVTDDGEGRLHYGGLCRLVERRSADAGVPTPGLHDFRRCFAVTMLRSGVDLVRLAHLMGHSNLEVLRRYLSLCTDDIRAAHMMGSPVDRLD
jgi:integrase/recombinase XerD